MRCVRLTEARCGETGRRQHCLVDHRVGVLLEVTQQPAGCDPRMPARILAGDQDRQLERIGEADAQKLPRRRLGDGQVAALDRTPEDAQRVALQGRRFSFLGAGGLRDSRTEP